ncbi:OmpA family lipoprotein [Shewanella colwelliana]|uniref:OmpA family lipoprotein n=2 Tax=Shewanella colwelliana TaxID=23 RepID=A0A1E5IQB9_SHECO|nr:OmpA family protein [Shewanella colwelliana]MDX1279793.1 OmpA family protein [Shewanella colwelliana]OEG72657.1 OmpA family lipoprotein [Shewanella colwelliana]
MMRHRVSFGVSMHNNKLSLIGMIVSASLLLSACQTTNPYTNESQNAKATNGAIIGAIAGAAIGVASSSKSDRGKGALIGAASGAAVGGGIGYYMDVQEAELRKQLQSTGVSVTRSGDDIILNMPNEITFGVDQSHLSDRAKQVLNSVALVGKEYDETKLNIMGFTDSSGSESYNLRLSQVRASEVANYLASQQIANQRIASHGMGESRPIASNDTKAGRAQNRRVEIILSPIAKN